MDTAKKEPQMLHPEQNSQQEKPWLRQKGESALWYMRFRRYLDLGPKRSLRAALMQEPTSQKTTKGNRKPQSAKSPQTIAEVSVPGAWSRAAKVWNWKERAAAYDLAQMEKEAQNVRESANIQPFSSRSYRIFQLNYCARVLQTMLKPEQIQQIERNEYLKQNEKRNELLSIMARYQSIMRDIAKEMEGLEGITADACDSAAWKYIVEEVSKGKTRTS